MRVYFTTVVRGAPVGAGGEIVSIDWATKRILSRRPMPPRDLGISDPNPRGNARGGRGIVIVGDEVIGASYHTLHVFSRDLEPRREVTAGLFAGLHEIHHPGNGKLWVSSTSIDAALEVDLATGAVTKEFWPREMAPFQAAFGLAPLPLDKTADNRVRFLTFGRESHLHLNAVTTSGGDVYALFNALGAVVNLTHGRVIVQDARIVGAHNLCIDDSGIVFVNDTRGHHVCVYDGSSGDVISRIGLMDFAWVRNALARHLRAERLRQVAKRLGLHRPARSAPLFVRGLRIVGDRLFVGASPAMILEVDWRSGHLVDAYQFSTDLDCCIHGLCPDPAERR